MNTKNNQRFQETEQRIIQVFTDLLAEKDAGRISIREICEKAQINRSSFYLHFQDVYDLMERIESYLMVYSGHIFSDPVEGYDLGEHFVRYFDFIKEHQAFFKAYLNNQHEIHLLSGSIDEAASVAYRETIDRLGYQSEQELLYHNAFFQAGLTALVREWLNRGCQETTKELGDILRREYHPDKFRSFKGSAGNLG